MATTGNKYAFQTLCLSSAPGSVNICMWQIQRIPCRTEYLFHTVYSTVVTLLHFAIRSLSFLGGVGGVCLVCFEFHVFGSNSFQFNFHCLKMCSFRSGYIVFSISLLFNLIEFYLYGAKSQEQLPQVAYMRVFCQRKKKRSYNTNATLCGKS